MNAPKRAEIFSRLKAANPEPRSELRFANEFQLLVAVMLSAQSTDKAVNRATEKLFAVADTPEKILALGPDELKRHIRSIGLYNTKAKNIVATAQAIVGEHGGRVPRTRAALEALPGVGRKTANVILNTAFGEPTIAVDTHIFRVANRTRLACGKTPYEVEQRLLKFTPEPFRHHAHHWLILHGRYVCVARYPKCASCIINDLCEFSDKLL
ncbi:endonuclease III [soil metagenome]